MPCMLDICPAMAVAAIVVPDVVLVIVMPASTLLYNRCEHGGVHEHTAVLAVVATL